MKELKDIFITHWISFDEYDQTLVQFYTFFPIWLQQIGVV